MQAKDSKQPESLLGAVLGSGEIPHQLYPFHASLGPQRLTVHTPCMASEISQELHNTFHCCSLSLEWTQLSTVWLSLSCRGCQQWPPWWPWPWPPWWPWPYGRRHHGDGIPCWQPEADQMDIALDMQQRGECSRQRVALHLFSHKCCSNYVKPINSGFSTLRCQSATSTVPLYVRAHPNLMPNILEAHSQWWNQMIRSLLPHATAVTAADWVRAAGALLTWRPPGQCSALSGAFPLHCCQPPAVVVWAPLPYGWIWADSSGGRMHTPDPAPIESPPWHPPSGASNPAGHQGQCQTGAHCNASSCWLPRNMIGCARCNPVPYEHLISASQTCTQRVAALNR